MADSQQRGEGPLGRNNLKKKMDRILESIKDFVKKEDPLMWLSLFIAAIISIIFYVFAVIFVRFYG